MDGKDRHQVTQEGIELHTKTPYRIPGLDGLWMIRGLETEGMGASGKAILHMQRVKEVK